MAPRWGPPLGGLLLALDGWQGVFLVNLPLLVVPLVVSWRWIPARRRASSSAGFDLSGAALLCASLVALAWLLNGRGPITPASAGFAAVVAASAAAFTWPVLRHSDPVLDLRLFCSCSRGGRGWSSTGIAIAVAPAAFSFGAFALSPLGGRLSDRLGHRHPAALGWA